MKTQLPSWHCIVNLGDVNPYEHGGDFVLVDKRGIYEPELWHWCPDSKHWSRFSLTRCHEVAGSAGVQVGDNRYHTDHVAWFSRDDRLRESAITSGISVFELKDLLCSTCPVELAEGYLTLAAHHGFEEFDAYPETLRDTKKVIARFKTQVVATGNWTDGIGV